jgi:hypothetical protein
LVALVSYYRHRGGYLWEVKNIFDFPNFLCYNIFIIKTQIKEIILELIPVPTEVLRSMNATMKWNISHMYPGISKATVVGYGGYVQPIDQAEKDALEQFCNDWAFDFAETPQGCFVGYIHSVGRSRNDVPQLIPLRTPHCDKLRYAREYWDIKDISQYVFDVEL